MSHVDKTEDHVSKLHREYQDHWCKYAEAMERGEESVKVHVTVFLWVLAVVCMFERKEEGWEWLLSTVH
jgi:hypothetical protein